MKLAEFYQNGGQVWIKHQSYTFKNYQKLYNALVQNANPMINSAPNWKILYPSQFNANELETLAQDGEANVNAVISILQHGTNESFNFALMRSSIDQDNQRRQIINRIKQVHLRQNIYNSVLQVF